VDEVIRVADRYYILATSLRVDTRAHVLKDADTFAIFDRHGDIHSLELGEQGLYRDGTRFLSKLEVRLGFDRPLLLSSVVREDNVMLMVDLTNPDARLDGKGLVAANSVHLFRSCFLRDRGCYQRLRIRNFAVQALELAPRVVFDADFVDIFEVRSIDSPRKNVNCGHLDDH
jgi:glycogen debranching enzyme